MAKRRNARTRQHPSSPGDDRRRVAIVGVVIVVITIGIILWRVQSGNNQAARSGSGGEILPTPIGFPEIAQDVGTLVGRPAPAFTLKDDADRSVSFAGGQASWPTVLIFHMGFR